MNHSQAREDVQRAVEQMCNRHVIGHPFPKLYPAVLLSALAVASTASAHTLDEASHEPERYISTAESRSTEAPAGPGDFVERDGYSIFEGDMLLQPEQVDALSDSNVTLRAFGHDRALERWPNGIIPYGFDDGINSQQRTSILAAIQHYHNRTRITFVEAGSTDDYETRLVFRPVGGCASYVGRTAQAEQDIFVEGCPVGSIIHELGHAIGLYHEHSRRDRDNFIRVNWDEIASGKEANFEILTANSQHYSQYDYGSIMHYGEYFFSKSGNKTIEAPDGITIGQRQALSLLDIASINAMYATDLDLSVSVAENKISASDGMEIDGLTMDLAVTNIGNLGANELELVMQLGSDVEWLTITEGSGWNCAISASILTCQMSTMASESTSRFTITADPKGANADDLSVRLSSLTQDTELSNNGYSATESTTGQVIIAATTDSAEDSATQDPKLGAAESGDTAGDATGAGGSGPMLLAIAGLLLIRRQRLRGNTFTRNLLRYAVGYRQSAAE